MSNKKDHVPFGGNNELTVLDQYQYPFENVVFEGGSNKLLSYCGAVKALEDSGVWKQIRRLAGTGTGSVIASLLAVGFNSQQLQTFFKDDLANVIKDRKCGHCCLCCVSSGYNPGKSILKWMGDKFRESTGKSDVTFAELQKRFNKELCVVVTNLNEGGLEYHHVKTTPDLPVVQSVRMSLATPTLMETVRKKDKKLKAEDLYLEGGILCNYPVHSYDGWWLSQQPCHAFLKKIPNFSSLQEDPFATFNSKTIGFVTCDDSNVGNLPKLLLDQVHDVDPVSKRNDSNLLKNTADLTTSTVHSIPDSQYVDFVLLANQFIKFLDDLKKSPQDNFTRDDLRAIFNRSQLSDNELQLLFGTIQITVDDIFRLFMTKTTKEVTIQDLHSFLEKRRNMLHKKCTLARTRKLKNKIDELETVYSLIYTNNLNSTLLNNARNLERTVIIRNGEIHSLKKLDDKSRKFLIERGNDATRRFLEQYVKKVPLLKEDGERASFNREDLKQFIDDDVSEVIDEKDYMESYLEKVL